ncbi:MAG TPA: TOMM precursor leader peptide-binding protein [Longimicrobium sp.]|nr:TOMM precursor leader peptide-binding protein [Longimicrobium sp.]
MRPPLVPRVADRFVVAALEDGRVRARSLAQIFAFRSRPPELLPRLLELMDGERTLHDLLASLADLPRTSVLAAVGQLTQAGVVEEARPGARLPEAERARFRAQVAFFAHFLDAPLPAGATRGDLPASAAELQTRLWSSAVVVCGTGRLGSAVARALAGAGVGEIIVAGEGTVGPGDLGSESWFEPADLGRGRAEVLRERIEGLQPRPGCVDAGVQPGPLLEHLRRARVAVFCADSPDPEAESHFNRLCLAAGTPWLGVRWAAGRIQVGPTVIPHETACLSCWRSAAEPAGAADVAGECTAPPGAVAPGALPGAELAALEVVRAIAGMELATYGKLFTLDLLSFESRRERLLRDPRCPACGTEAGEDAADRGEPAAGAARAARLSERFHENSKMSRRDWETLRQLHDPRCGYTPHPEPVDAVPLPAVPEFAPGTLGDVLKRRRSSRSFGGAPLTADELSRVLFFASGVTGQLTPGDGEPRPIRGAPSAGALYPLDVEVITAPGGELPAGRYRYYPEPHALQPVPGGAQLREFTEHTFFGEALAGAAAIVVLTATFERTQRKYGERGYRYVLLEAGHVAQNLLLGAAALGMEAAPLGGFLDREIDRLLGVDGLTRSCVYMVALGKRPADAGKG